MISRKNKLSIVFLSFLSILSLLPSLLIGFVDRIDIFYKTEIFFVTFSIILTLILFYRFFPRLISFFLGALAVIAVISVGLMLTYNSPINASYIGIFMETNLEEAFAFFKGLPFFVLLIFIFLIFISLYCIVYNFAFSKKIWEKLFLLNFIVLFITGYFIFNFSYKTTPLEVGENSDVMFLTETKNEMVRMSFPISIPFAIKDYFEQRDQLVRYAGKYVDFHFDIAHKPQYDERQIHILVIGETGRADHWGVNGYSRNTSPYLSARDDVISFKNMYVFEALTRYSVPVILTRKPINLIQDYYHEPSIVTYFKNIGFDTAWISLSQQLGRIESAIAIAAYEADKQIFLNMSDFNYKTKPDYVSIQEVEKMIDSTQGNLFIILHTLGSHQRYIDRYDEKMRIFLPDRYEDKEANIYDHSAKEVFVNSYDNSIIATDYFLGNLIEALEKRDLSSFVFYVADHGESLFDDGNMAIGHGFKSFATLHVPAFFWASKQFKMGNQELIDNLKYNATHLTSIDMMFETLVSLSGGKMAEARPHLDMTQKELVLSPALLNLLREKNILDNIVVSLEDAFEVAHE